MSAAFSLVELVEQLRREPTAMSFRDASLRCLVLAHEFAPDDLAIPSLLAGAQTFAMLAVAEALTAPGSGLNVAEVLGSVHGVQV